MRRPIRSRQGNRVKKMGFGSMYNTIKWFALEPGECDEKRDTLSEGARKGRRRKKHRKVFKVIRPDMSKGEYRAKGKRVHEKEGQKKRSLQGDRQ